MLGLFATSISSYAQNNHNSDKTKDNQNNVTEKWYNPKKLLDKSKEVLNKSTEAVKGVVNDIIGNEEDDATTEMGMKGRNNRIEFSEKATAMKFIDERRIYLIDLTRSMEGLNGSENIFQTVKDQLLLAIQSINDPTTEIVLIPFTDHPIEVIKGTIANKDSLVTYINALETKKGDTNILSAWEKGVEYLDNNKINYMFMLTDGVHNTGKPIEDLYDSLEAWHGQTQGKYQFAFYVLLSPKAREQKISEIVENSKQIWLVPSLNINSDFIIGKMNLSVNIKDNNRVMLHLTCTNPEIFNDGFTFKISIPENKYYRIKNASNKIDKDGYIVFEIEKLKPQKELPVSYHTVINIEYNSDEYPLVFFTPEGYNLNIMNVGDRIMIVKMLKQ